MRTLLIRRADLGKSRQLTNELTNIWQIYDKLIDKLVDKYIPLNKYQIRARDQIN